MEKIWHTLSLPQVIAEVRGDEKGLSREEVKKRLVEFGRNELPEERGHSLISLFFGQFANPLMYIMMVATGVSFALDNIVESVFIFCVMISNALVGFYQEHKANQSLRALKNMIRRKARVLRENQESEVEAGEIVPGDILILRAGDEIVADGRIFESKNLRVTEASLTGESRPVDKKEAIVSRDAEVAERLNMVFAGTFVEEGSANVVVVATGSRTEYGDIVSMLKETSEESTPLQKMVVSLSKFIGTFITCTVLLIIAGGFFLGRDLLTIFEVSLALFVSAIPEGLLPGITIVLVLGMRRILRQKGLVRRLAATETLGGVTVICTDKTGTLTEGKMEVDGILTTNGFESREVMEKGKLSDFAFQSLQISLLTIDGYIENPGEAMDKLIVRGNLTEQALLRMSALYGLDAYKLREGEPMINNILFSSERKYAASLRRTEGGGKRLYMLGAPEEVLKYISAVAAEGGEESLKGKVYVEMHKKYSALMEDGYRVIACAYRDISSSTRSENVEVLMKKMTLVGFIAITDPVRGDVARAFQITKEAGIRTIMITGDHALTAKLVAEKVGLRVGVGGVLEGHQIENMSDEELRVWTKKVVIYARVSPRHKLRLVKALQKNGEVVAMLGDGVNDAPALKAADIGVAVDPRISVAREVADIVLLDGGFSTITHAIEQGRIIFNNIRKVFLYLITQDFSQFLIFITSIIFQLPLPVLAAQLLLVNLVESGLPDLALTTEQEKEGVMQEPPRDPHESILNAPALRWMISVFAVSGCIAMSLYIFLLGREEIEKVRTMMMVFLCLESLFLVFAVRSFKKSIIRKEIFSNRILVWAVAISFLMVLAAVYLPTPQLALKTVSLAASDWLIIVTANLCEIMILDRLKLFFFRKKYSERKLTAAFI